MSPILMILPSENIFRNSLFRHRFSGRDFYGHAAPERAHKMRKNLNGRLYLWTPYLWDVLLGCVTIYCLRSLSLFSILGKSRRNNRSRLFDVQLYIRIDTARSLFGLDSYLCYDSVHLWLHGCCHFQPSWGIARKHWKGVCLLGFALNLVIFCSCCEAWWLIGRFDAFRLKGRGFESRSSRHVGTLGKSFTHNCLWRFGLKLQHRIRAVSWGPLSGGWHNEAL